MKDLEERVCVKFCFKLGKTATEMWKMLQQAFGDECMSQTQCFEWYNHFKAGRISMDEDPRSGRPSTSTDDIHIDAVHDLILQNRRLTIREIAKDVGISFGSYQAILRRRNIRAMQQLTRLSLCAVFWRKTKRPLYPSHPTLQIWLQRTFFCFLS